MFEPAVDPSDMCAKHLQANEHLKAAGILRGAGEFKLSAALQWTALRIFLFAWLENRQVAYGSTREALQIALSDEALFRVRGDLMFAHLVGTMAEWDEYFSIDASQLDDLERRCAGVRQALAS